MNATYVRFQMMRLFRNRPEYRFVGRIHEQHTGEMPLHIPERFEVTDLHVLHYGYGAICAVAMGELAARGAIPIATGEIEATAWGFAQLLRARAAHIHQTDACVCGGVGEWLKAAHAAGAFGVPVAPHWHHNLHAQLLAAIPNGLVVEHFALEEDVYNFEQLLEPATRAVVAGGAIELNDLPGIGIRYDPDAVERYTLVDA